MSVQEEETFNPQYDTLEEAPAPGAQDEVPVEKVVYVQPNELPEIKLFGRWSCDDVQVSDISLAVSIPYFQLPPFPLLLLLAIVIFLLTFRITLQLRRNMLVTLHIRLADMLQNDSVKHNVQLLKD